ncbi:UNVERIFIED_CONTAM: hypothetical protein Slati_1907000 [Sesamum latifolium]|uniref:Retrotransposon gag domain-containing protein n=1 Tax=Sesamum latifolium TaxID=2727402 RepID=A0AAW2X6P7_9LAMI
MAETAASSRGLDKASVSESLQLHGSDHPGMILINVCLTVSSTKVRPAVTDPSFEHWVRVDSMVTTWILNSISKDIVEGFMNTKSARRLWLDLEEHYGGCNGPQLCHIQRQITFVSQGTTDVGAYFTKLRKLLDELDVLTPTPQCTCNGCTCGASKAVADLAAYAMVVSVEKQREVHMELNETVESAAMHVKSNFRKEDRHVKSNFRKEDMRRGPVDKKVQYCDHCSKSGHIETHVLKFTEHRIGTKR